MLVKAPGHYGLYCPDCGLKFITETLYNQMKGSERGLRCRCGKIAEFETALFDAAKIDGCDFCKKIPAPSPCLYDAKCGKVYCHQHCYMCARKHCTVPKCLGAAVVYMVLVLQDGGEYIVPTALCNYHRNGMLKKLNQLENRILVWKNVKEIYPNLPDIKDCDIIFKDY